MRPIDPAAAAERARGYAICTTQRSGSTYLCQLLSSTGVLGRPLDYFNAAARRDRGWYDYPDDPELQLEAIVDGSTPNGVYGCKVFAQHLDVLAPTAWTRRLPDLRWIHLFRHDLVGQAISLVIAKQTGRWRSNGAARGAAVYDADAIRREMADIARDNARWRLFFALHGLRPLEIPYDALVADPQGAARAVGSLMALDKPVRIEPSHIEVTVQRDDASVQWRERFMAEAARSTQIDAIDAVEAPSGKPHACAFPAIVARRPRLTVSIITKDSQARLPRLLDEASNYADEIVVGVDASSADGTLEAAAAGADTVYQFRLSLPGQLSPARMLPFRYATGDWILSLDDDESMEDSFDALVPELMRTRGGVTHFYFPRKWIVNAEPWEYVHAAPWFPNWAPRMFRNDASLVWKPARAHTMYHVQGPGYHESRTSILHFEPLWCTPQQRNEKLESYRNAGAAAASEEFYAISREAPRRGVAPRSVTARSGRPARKIVHPEVQELAASPLLPWGSAVLRADVPEVARAGEMLIAEVTVRNTGSLAWTPTYAQWPAEQWPLIRLSYHLLDAEGTAIDWHDGPRMQLSRFVAPGDEVTFIDQIVAPAAPGEYVLEWDMLSENDCWFAQCGGAVHRSRIEILPA